ncbi:MAG: AAA family ATPase [Oscillospiraceae bacterium]|nr:AAA family ATPase [Oscillospiraceae bacterium]
MILLKRVRLINWHNFIDNTIDFKKLTYLIGVNAVGKTTIMDAIRYCITTNKEFNSAGNKKSKRTLQGSVHQKQRADDEYLRPGHTVSYIGLEFLDDQNNKRFVIVTRVESESPGSNSDVVTEDWYVSKPGYCLEDMPFFIEEKDGHRPSKKEEFKLDNHALDRAASRTDARKRICRQLGIGDSEYGTGKKFNKVFHMGTSLEGIDDIRKFIYTYILPEPEMNIEGLYKDMQELENLQQIYEESRKKSESLKMIVEHLETAFKYDSRVKSYELLVEYADLQSKLHSKVSMENDIRNLETELTALRSKLQRVEDERNDAEKRLREIQKRIGDDEYHRKMESLKEELSSLQKKYDALRIEAHKYDTSAAKLKKVITELAAESILNGIQDIPSPDSTEYIESIRTIQSRMVDAEDDISQRIASTINEISTLDDQITELNSKINQLEKGKLVYPKECTLVINEINRLFDEHGIKERAKLLCELLYMSHPEWQEAVESYLNTQRFYIIVSSENYLLAKQVFISLKDSVKKAGLIDTISLMKRKKFENREVLTLAKTVETENHYARAYIDYLLGNVVCCEADELEKYEKSITKDRLCYQGFVLRRLKRQEQYIGQDAIVKQLEKANSELRNNQIRKQELSADKIKIKSINNDYHKVVSGDSFQFLIEYCNSRAESERCYTTIETLNDRINELESNPMLKGMIDREKECQMAYNDANKACTNIEADIKNKDDKLQSLKKSIISFESVISETEKKYSDMELNYSRYVADMQQEYAQMIKNQTPQQIVDNSQRGIMQRRINERDNFVNDTLIPLQRQYNADYSLDYLLGIEGTEQYQSSYSSLVRIDIEKHTENLRLAQQRCRERFRKEVLFRMKDDIQHAFRSFKELNKVMNELSYGEEKFEFYISGSQDKKLNDFYKLIMDKDNRQIQDEPDLFTISEEPVSDMFEDQINDFMQCIMSEVEEHTRQKLSGEKTSGKSLNIYADYRTYLDYDIKVLNTVTKKEARLSKVSGDGSGGENQAPFYIAICASLMQIYKQSENSIQLVLLDEAFNNMTSDRIKPMMEMFRTLNLQLILIATPEKCSSIFPYCDLTYSIIKQGSRNTVASFEGVSS